MRISCESFAPNCVKMLRRVRLVRHVRPHPKTKMICISACKSPIKASGYNEKKHSRQCRKCFIFSGGRWRIRTADPLLVRQMLWTSWAKRPLALGLFPVCVCKVTTFFYSCKIFQHFFQKKSHFLRFFLFFGPKTPCFALFRSIFTSKFPHLRTGFSLVLLKNSSLLSSDSARNYVILQK